MLYACGTKPLPDEFLAAPQASSLLSVDDNGPWFRSIPRSHDFSSPIILEMKKNSPDSGDGLGAGSAKGMPPDASPEGIHER